MPCAAALRAVRWPCPPRATQMRLVFAPGAGSAAPTIDGRPAIEVLQVWPYMPCSSHGAHSVPWTTPLVGILHPGFSALCQHAGMHAQPCEQQAVSTTSPPSHWAHWAHCQLWIQGKRHLPSAPFPRLITYTQACLTTIVGEQEAIIHDVCQSNALEIAQCVAEMDTLLAGVDALRASLQPGDDALQVRARQAATASLPACLLLQHAPRTSPFARLYAYAA